MGDMNSKHFFLKDRSVNPWLPFLLNHEHLPVSWWGIICSLLPEAFTSVFWNAIKDCRRSACVYIFCLVELFIRLEKSGITIHFHHCFQIAVLPVLKSDNLWKWANSHWGDFGHYLGFYKGNAAEIYIGKPKIRAGSSQIGRHFWISFSDNKKGGFSNLPFR